MLEDKMCLLHMGVGREYGECVRWRRGSNLSRTPTQHGSCSGRRGLWEGGKMETRNSIMKLGSSAQSAAAAQEEMKDEK